MTAVRAGQIQIMLGMNDFTEEEEEIGGVVGELLAEESDAIENVIVDALNEYFEDRMSTGEFNRLAMHVDIYS